MTTSGPKSNFFSVKEISPLTEKATATVIFLHGAGDSGPGVEMWMKCRLFEEAGLTFPHFRILYPTAPKRPYSAARGEKIHVWFDWPAIDPSLPEDLTSIDFMGEQLSSFIDEIIQEGTEPNRIVLGGLSMGGAMALHLGYRYHTNLAGVFALSTFLNNESSVYKELQEHRKSYPPLFQTHGTRDRLIRHEWGERSFQMLKTLGVHGTFHTYPSLEHDMCKEELGDLREWIIDVLSKQQKDDAKV